jgi:hypothetical protein
VHTPVVSDKCSTTAPSFVSGVRQLVDALHIRARCVSTQVRLEMCKARLQSIGFCSLPPQGTTAASGAPTPPPPVALASPNEASMPPPLPQAPKHHVPWVDEGAPTCLDTTSRVPQLSHRMALHSVENPLAHRVLCVLQGMLLPGLLSSNVKSEVGHLGLFRTPICVNVTMCSTGTVHVAVERVSQPVRDAAVANGALGFKPLLACHTLTPSPVRTTASGSTGRDTNSIRNISNVMSFVCLFVCYTCKFNLYVGCGHPV